MLYRFRIIRRRDTWRVETWDPEPPYGPAWQPAYSGALTIDEARAFLADARVLHWDDDSHLTGHYTFGSTGP